MDYLRGAKIFKYNKKSNKSINISSLGNFSYKKIIKYNSNINNCSSVNRIKSPGNLSCTAPTNVSNNSKLYKNSMIYSIKNISFVPNKKNKKIYSKEHKKTKSINIGPMSYPCFNCFFNIINDNGNSNNNNSIGNNNIITNKSKLNNITIDMNYGKTKKKIIFFYDKNN